MGFKYDFFWKQLFTFHLLPMFKAITRSRLEVFYKKGVIKNFAKFTGKYLYQSLFFNKVAGPCPATLLRKRLF